MKAGINITIFENVITLRLTIPERLISLNN